MTTGSLTVSKQTLHSKKESSLLFSFSFWPVEGALSDVWSRAESIQNEMQREGKRTKACFVLRNVGGDSISISTFMRNSLDISGKIPERTAHS